MQQGIVESPQSGVQRWRNQHGFKVLRLHYEADQRKGEGKKVYVKELDRWLSPWAAHAHSEMTNPALYLQEYEIDAEATLGQLLYHMDPEATVEKSFPIPQNWTRRMSLDPHPGIPHAFLWCATDPWGDRWYYRELWPSKVCFRYSGGMLIGKPGPCPSDDNRTRISEYVDTLRWLESKENPENGGEDEDIYARVIDYAARAFGKGSNDDPEQENFQQRYEKYMTALKVERPWFDDAKKDHDAGHEAVAEGLKVIDVMGNDGEYHKRSRIHIFSDRCPELIWQLKNNRKKQLSPLQVESQDPSGQVVKVRNHMTDNLRYVEMANPVYVPPTMQRDDIPPAYEGTSW